MRMKKTLAGILASALTLTSLTVVSLADNESANEKVLASSPTDISLWGENAYEVGADKLIQVEDLDTYANIAVTFSVDALPPNADNPWQQNQIVKVYGKAYGEGYEWSEKEDENKAANGEGIIKGVDGVEVGETYTVKFSVADVLDDLQKKLHDGDEVKSTISAIAVSNVYQVDGSKVTVSKVALVKASEEELNSLITIPFEDKAYELTVSSPTWASGEKVAQAENVVTIDGITYGTTTFNDIKGKTLKLTGIVFKNCDIDITAYDISVCLFIQSADYAVWQQSSSVDMGKSILEWDLSTITDVADTVVIGKIGYQITIGVGNIPSGFENDDKINVNQTIIDVTGITLDKTTLSLKPKGTATLTPTVTPSNATDPTVTWESSDEAVATVDDGVVTAVAKGTATITAKAGDKTAECEVTVSNPATKITADPISVLEKESATIAVTVVPEDADELTYSYASKDTSIATVDTAGKVTGIKAGTTVVTVSAKVDDETTLTADCAVTVTDTKVPATKVELDKATLELEVDGTATLKATVTPANSTDNVTWSSSDETVATVDAAGKVTAVKVGKAVITATAGDQSAECEVTVSAKTVAITSVTLDKTTASVEEGANVQLTATVKPDSTTEDKTVTWTSSDETVATVDNTGKVTGVKAGEATIKAAAGTKFAECKVTVTAKKTDEPTPDTPDKPTLPDGYEQASEKKGKGTIAASEDDPTVANPYLATLSQDEYKFTEDNYILVTVAPAETPARAVVDTSKWRVQLKAFDAAWGGWQGPQSDEGVLSVGVSVKDILSANKFDGVDLLSGINIEVSGAPVGTNISYNVVTGVKETEAPSDHETDTSKWIIGVLGFDSSWNGWNGDITRGEAGELSYEVTVKELMEVNNIAEIDSFGGFSAQVWDVQEGDKIKYEITVTHDGETEPFINKTGTHEVVMGKNDKGEDELQKTLGQFTSSLAFSYGDYEFEENDTIKVNVSDANKSDKPENPTNGTVLWEGETVMGNWAAYVTVTADKLAEAKAGDKIIVTVKDVEDEAQISFKAATGDWEPIPGFKAIDSQYGCDTLPSDKTEYTYTLTEEDIAVLDGVDLIIGGKNATLTKAVLSVQSTGSDQPGTDEPGNDEPTPSAPVTLPSGSFTAPSTSGSSTSSNDTTAAPDNGTSAPAPAVADTAAPADDTTDNGDDSSSAPAQFPGNGDVNTGNANQEPTGNTNTGNTDDKNVATGLVFAFIPAAAAAIGVVISKKRK